MLDGKKGFTLIEAIFSIVIMALVLIGGFQIVGKIYTRNYIAKESARLEFESQSVLDELAMNLYHRIPLSVIGYDQNNNKFKYIGEIEENETYPILEWIGYLNDAMIDRNLSGFIDLYASQKPVLRAIDFNASFINTILSNKFNGSYNILSSAAIIFAGAFDRGEEIALYDYKNAFGWHKNDAKLIYIISDAKQDGSDCNISIKNSDKSDVNNIKIYEKFYLVDTAYAVALKKDLNKSKWNCKDLNWDEVENSDLLLFFNYRPWNKETFCADGGEGNVTILAGNVKAFKIKKVNLHLELKIEFFKKRGDINISVSKQKVTF